MPRRISSAASCVRGRSGNRWHSSSESSACPSSKRWSRPNSSPRRNARATCAIACWIWRDGTALKLLMNTTVTGFRPDAGGWRIDIRDGAPLGAGALVVATGGLSVPSTGSDGAGLRIAEALGHTIQPTYAALTPLTANPAPFASLSGVSLPVTVTARADGLASTATGGFLFTHHGYSGPAILDVSHVAVRSRSQASPPRGNQGALDHAWRRGVDADPQTSGLSQRCWRPLRRIAPASRRSPDRGRRSRSPAVARPPRPCRIDSG